MATIGSFPGITKSITVEVERTRRHHETYLLNAPLDVLVKHDAHRMAWIERQIEEGNADPQGSMLLSEADFDLLDFYLTEPATDSTLTMPENQSGTTESQDLKREVRAALEGDDLVACADALANVAEWLSIEWRRQT